jgi:hypothetical protein
VTGGGTDYLLLAWCGLEHDLEAAAKQLAAHIVKVLQM